MTIRNLGQSIGRAITRPDGGQGLLSDLTTYLPRGAAESVAAFQVPRATDKIVNGSSTTSSERLKSLKDTYDLPSVIFNPLENFASYTPVWTLAALEPKQYNNPPSYRENPRNLKHVVLSSAGRFDADRVKTVSGVPEFFINNFTMKATVGANQKTGNSNAFNFSWEIYEPYSMGLLLQSLQVAAQNAGFLNYLNNTPFCLRLDFMGWDETGKPYTTIKPKFFVLGLSSIKFTVDEKGSTYKMEGFPFNHKGFSDIINTAYNDVKIVAKDKGTVEEVLADANNKESLVGLLNRIEKKLVEDKQIKFPDVYDIQFPTSSSDFTPQQDIAGTKKATANPKETESKIVLSSTNTSVKVDFDSNEIGGASLGFDQSKGGNFAMLKNDRRDEKTGLIERGKMTIDPKKRVFQFAQGQSLTSIINQIVLSSDYAKKAIDPVNKTKEGYIKWFRLDVQIELLQYDDWIGDYAKKITYRVVPFFVHETIFTNPNSAPGGYEDLRKKIMKGYNYIYTGQNVDVLKFDIQINNLFFTGINPSTEKDSGKGSDPNTSGGTVPQTNKKTETTQGSSPGAQVATLNRPRIKRNPELIDEKIKGGDGGTSTERKVAEAFHSAFVNQSSEMVTVNLEILGDPYWIVDSGMANYFAKPSANNAQVTEDGTMNYESGDVYVYLAFKTPVDYNENTGLMDYPYGGKASFFSGIYRVSACESKFTEGTFKQVITCLRMPGQAGEYKEAPKEITSTIKPNKQTSTTTSVTESVPERSGVADTNTASTGIKIYAEDGTVSNIRRNPETGELYDATGLP